MKHYVLDARTATPHYPGIGRYVSNLARAIVPLLNEDERLTVICDPAHPVALPPSEAARTIPLAVSPFSPRQQWVIPRLLRRFNARSAVHPASNFQPPAASLYHSPYIAMPYRPGAPTLLTVYDLIPLRYPEYSTARARLLIRGMTRLALRAARHVIAISEFTRRDFIAEFGLSPERITAIPLAADPAFCPQPREASAAVRARYGLPEQFILYLGSNKPHKNLVRLVAAWRMAYSKWQMADRPAGWPIAQASFQFPHLVIAGAWDPRYPEARNSAESAAHETSATDGRLQPATCNLQPILWLGPVPEADLPALYSAATAFVFPSLYEGFGLPVLEAMACGTPVICSAASSLPEVTGDAALLVDPTDTGALAAAIARLMSDEALRLELARRGLAQAARFSWERTAAATLDLYRRLAHPSAAEMP